MCPFELVATATDSPRYSPGGSLRKFGTEVKGISGTFWALAFCCASAGATPSMRAIAETDAIQRVMKDLPGPLVNLRYRKRSYRQFTTGSRAPQPIEGRSPDGAKRNPGTAGVTIVGSPRITLRSIRATGLTRPARSGWGRRAAVH